jgi:creatinine amidohydrolase
MNRTWLSVAAVLGTAVFAAPAHAQTSQSERERETQELLRAPRPIAAADAVYVDEMTWMEVRDAIAAGKTTAIVATGGIEQNGPYVVTGKHNVVLQGTCAAIARKLGNALCAPVIKFVPEGNIHPPSGHMRFPGTISLREETYQMLLDDVASSLQAHGFKDIVLIGDSGGNQDGLEAVAKVLNERWAGTGSKAHFFLEYYEKKQLATTYMAELGYPETVDGGEHDNARQTVLMMAVDPASVRYDQRMASGLATINGVDISAKQTMIEVGNRVRDYHAEVIARDIRAAIARARGATSR